MLSSREGALRGSMALYVLVLILHPTLSSSEKVSKDFAKGFGIPLYESMGGCSEGLETLLTYAIKSDGELPFDCVTFQGDGENCSWTDFSGAVIGIVVAPILTIFICCGLCCARCFTPCECCCKPCGQQACGGVKPTKPSYPPWEQGLTWGCLAIAWIAVLSFSIVGFLSFLDFKANWEDLVDGGVALYEAPSELKADVSDAITKIKDDAVGFIDTSVNPLFDNLDPVRNNLNSLRTELATLQTSVRELQRYVEGCDTEAAGWTDGACRDDSPNFHTQCIGQAEEHYTAGQGVVMSDGTIAPNCNSDLLGTPGPCPCCTLCTTIINDIQDVIDSIPSEARVNELDQPLDTSQVSEDVDAALGDWEKEIDNLEEGNEPLEWLSKNKEDLKGYLGSGRVEGGALLFFLLSWLVCLLVLLAVALNFAGGAGGSDLPGYMWWTAFTLGVIHFVLILSPFFGIFSLVAIPYGGFCDEPPNNGGNADVERFLNECLFDANKYIWPLIDTGDGPITKQTIEENLAEFDSSEQIDETAIDEVLTDVDEYTSSYNKDDIDSLDNTNNLQSYGVTQNCNAFEVAGSTAQDCETFLSLMSTYETDIRQKADAIQSAGATIQDLVDNTKTLAENYKVDIDNVFTNSETLINNMVDTAWEVGKCDRFEALYTGVSDPFDGILDAFIATWAALFMVGIFMPIMLCSMLHGAKLLYWARHPDDYVAGGAYVKPDDELAPQLSPPGPEPFTSASPPVPPIPKSMEQPGELVYPGSGAMMPGGGGMGPMGGLPPMSPQTTYAEERPFSEDNVTAPTAPVFFDAYTGANGGGDLGMYGAQSRTQHVYPYVDQGMA